MGSVNLLLRNIMIKNLRICKQRLRTHKRNRHLASLQMHTVNMIFRYPVTNGIKDKSLFYIVRKIKLHNHFNAVLMKMLHHILKFLTCIFTIGIRSLRCKVITFLVAPVINGHYGFFFKKGHNILIFFFLRRCILLKFICRHQFYGCYAQRL